MKIAIDLSQIPYDTGVSKYTKNLVNNLLNIDQLNEYLFFAGALRRKKEILDFNPNTKVFPMPPVVANLVWNTLHTLPTEKLIGQVDVLHTSDWAEPPSEAFKVTTIHDLSPMLLPNLLPRDKMRDIVSVHKKRLTWVMKESDRIIAVSQATKKDLVKLGFDENKIRVIYEALPVERVRASEDEVKAVKKKYNITEDYALTIGVNPRKNSEGIARAFEKATAGKDIKMIFTGVNKNVKLQNSKKIRVVGHVTDKEIAALFTGAKAFIYPSFYEGFGIPILEAFSYEVPVITSNISSMAEIAGGAAVLVDPYDTNSISEGIKKALAAPKTFIPKGLKRLQDFSWEKCARETLAVYNEAKI